MTMNRRAFSAALMTGVAASLISTRGMAANSAPVKASNVVLVHGLFADGSCWAEATASGSVVSGCWRGRMVRRC